MTGEREQDEKYIVMRTVLEYFQPGPIWAVAGARVTLVITAKRQEWVSGQER